MPAPAPAPAPGTPGARFYRIAKRSATETAAQLIVADRLGAANGVGLQQARQLLFRLVSMLVRMIRSCERRAA